MICAPAGVAATGLPDLLEHVLDALLDNALKFGRGGTVEVTARSVGDVAEIRVCDRGPGIPPEEQERVFEPYYRLDTSRNRASGGTGLGLSIARNIARWHGGDIRLQNASAGGLVAELYLPRC